MIKKNGIIVSSIYKMIIILLYSILLGFFSIFFLGLIPSSLVVFKIAVVKKAIGKATRKYRQSNPPKLMVLNVLLGKYTKITSTNKLPMIEYLLNG
jgi:hypothetical protein